MNEIKGKNQSPDTKEKTRSVKTKARIVNSRYKQSTENLSVSKYALGLNDTQLGRSLPNDCDTRPQKAKQSQKLSTATGNCSDSAISKKKMTLKPELNATRTGAGRTLRVNDSTSPYYGEGVLSSTMLGGVGGLPKNLPDLPDISQICPPTSKKRPKANNRATIEPIAENKIPDVPVFGETKNLTLKKAIGQKDIDTSYLSYLTWAYLDVSATKKHETDVTDAKNQVKFLQSLLDKKRAEILAAKQLISLVKWYDRISEFHTRLYKELAPLIEQSGTCNVPIRNLFSHLSQQLCQMKLHKIHQAEESQAEQRDKFLASLSETHALLKKLNEILSAKNESYLDIKVVLEGLLLQLDIALKCTLEVEKTAGIAIEESSLKLTTVDISLVS